MIRSIRILGAALGGLIGIVLIIQHLAVFDGAPGEAALSIAWVVAWVVVGYSLLPYLTIIPALGVLASLPASRVLQVSYEDLVAEPRQALLRLERFADLPDTYPGWLDRAVQLAKPRSPRWTALPHEQIHELTRVCEPAMRRLYGDSW